MIRSVVEYFSECLDLRVLILTIDSQLDFVGFFSSAEYKLLNYGEFFPNLNQWLLFVCSSLKRGEH